MPRSTMKLAHSKGSGEPSKPTEKEEVLEDQTGDQNSFSVAWFCLSRDFGLSPHRFQGRSLSAIQGFLLEKGQSGKTELPPGQGENGTECPT
jgi:hypothetical protein